MKRMFVFLIACFLCFSTVTISYAAVPAFDNTQWLELPSGFGGGSHNYPQSTVVTYSDLKAKQNNQTTTSNFPCNFNFTVSNMNRFN